jgi:aryl carrier-like protein
LPPGPVPVVEVRLAGPRPPARPDEPARETDQVWSARAEPPAPAEPERLIDPVDANRSEASVPTASTEPIALTEPAEPAGSAADPAFARFAALVAEVTGRPVNSLGPEDNVFDLGVDSRRLLSLASRTADLGGRTLSLEQFFNTDDLRGLAELAFPDQVSA